MATAIKTSRELLAATTSISAAATAGFTELNLSTALGGLLTIMITNANPAPTTDTVLRVWTRRATGGTNYVLFEGTAGQIASEVYHFPIHISKDVMFLDGEIVCGATNAITAEAFLQETTSIG